MRPIDADELNTHKFLTPQVKVIGGRRNGKTREKIIEAYQKGWNDCICSIVDNAPTVEPQKVLVANVTFDKEQLERLVRDRVIEPIKNGELVLQTDERPHGEWQEFFESNGKTYHKCSHCHISSELILFGNFCPNCGADMRGGEDNR